MRSEDVVEQMKIADPNQTGGAVFFAVSPQRLSNRANRWNEDDMAIYESNVICRFVISKVCGKGDKSTFIFIFEEKIQPTSGRINRWIESFLFTTILLPVITKSIDDCLEHYLFGQIDPWSNCSWRTSSTLHNDVECGSRWHKWWHWNSHRTMIIE